MLVAPESSTVVNPLRGGNIVTASAAGSTRHAFAPALHVHASGDILLVCRWDGVGTREGDASNEQRLYVSRNGGETWQLANAGRPIISLDHGSSFTSPSAISHAWFFAPSTDRLWLVYSVNQPHTWGHDDPSRSTGGGEIRRLELHRHATGTWFSSGSSAVLWPFLGMLPDGRGGAVNDVRAISWNGAIRTAAHMWLMPIGGRATVAVPRGEAAKLNRVWLLRSADNGDTWQAHAFVAGDDRRCFAEPTLVRTSVPGQLVCLLRVQYDTGRELYRTVSQDDGATWSEPLPTGLPNADTQGVKPFLFRASAGDYWLIQTNEHTARSRTNIAIFQTDEAGLLTDQWQRVRTLDIGNRTGWWPGCCYGWLTEDLARGRFLAAYSAATPEHTEVRFTAFDRSTFFDAPSIEPNGVHDEEADDRPVQLTAAGSFRLVSTRSRLIAPRFVTNCPQALQISFDLMIHELPAVEPLQLLAIGNRHGRDQALDLLVGSDGTLMVHTASVAITRAVTLSIGRKHHFACRVPKSGPSHIEVDGTVVAQAEIGVLSAAALQWGGGPVPRDPCLYTLSCIRY
jgi:hypothetical protein